MAMSEEASDVLVGMVFAMIFAVLITMVVVGGIFSRDYEHGLKKGCRMALHDQPAKAKFCREIRQETKWVLPRR